MIVCVVPGEGHTIKHVKVELKPDETLPNRYNTVEAEVWRLFGSLQEGWGSTLIKPRGATLAMDSEILTNPEINLSSIIHLTEQPKGGNLYEHRDIIRLDEADEEPDSGRDPNGSGNSNLVP